MHLSVRQLWSGFHLGFSPLFGGEADTLGGKLGILGGEILSKGGGGGGKLGHISKSGKLTLLGEKFQGHLGEEISPVDGTLVM